MVEHSEKGRLLATAVYEVEEIVLQDGTEIELKPLPMKYLRQVLKDFNGFMKTQREGTDEVDEDEAEFAFMDMLLRLTKTALKVYAPDKNYTVAQIEEIVDQPTMYRILDVGANLGLQRMADELEAAKDDPNFRAAMRA